MSSVFERVKADSKKGIKVKCVLKKNAGLKKAPNLDTYCVAATLYGEAGPLDDKGITRVAETIRNRYKYYDQNKAEGVNKINYRDIVAAPNQYLGFNAYKNMKLNDFKEFEKKLTGDEKKNWDRCMTIARQVVDGKLKTNYARGTLGFNKASVQTNKKMFKTNLVFKDDSKYADNPEKKSSHVFFGDFHISSLKNSKGKLLAKGGNPNQKNNLLAQAKIARAQTQRG